MRAIITLKREVKMKYTVIRLLFLIITVMFIGAFVSCDHPAVPSPDSDQIAKPEISEIRTREELLLYVEGGVKYSEDIILKPLDEEAKAVVYPVLRNVLFNDTDYIVDGNYDEISLLEPNGENLSGSYSIYHSAGADFTVYNGSATINGQILELRDYTIKNDNSASIKGSAKLDGEDIDIDVFLAMMDYVNEKGARRMDLYIGGKENSEWTVIWDITIKNGLYAGEGKLIYSEKVEDKTVSFCMMPYYIDPYTDRRIEYICFDDVFYDAEGVVDFLFNDVVSISIKDENDIEYENGSGRILKIEEGETINLEFLMIPDTAWETGVTWSATDPEGRPSFAVSIIEDEYGDIEMEAVSPGDVLLTVTSKQKPEVSCTIKVKVTALP